MEDKIITNTKLWKIDPSHSEVYFKVKHMMLYTVSGCFKEFSGQLSTESDTFENAQISFTANSESIYTQNQSRDNHLRSKDFFDSK